MEDNVDDVLGRFDELGENRRDSGRRQPQPEAASEHEIQRMMEEARARGSRDDGDELK